MQIDLNLLVFTNWPEEDENVSTWATTQMHPRALWILNTQKQEEKDERPEG